MTACLLHSAHRTRLGPLLPHPPSTSRLQHGGRAGDIVPTSLSPASSRGPLQAAPS